VGYWERPIPAGRDVGKLRLSGAKSTIPGKIQRGVVSQCDDSCRKNRGLEPSSKNGLACGTSLQAQSPSMVPKTLNLLGGKKGRRKEHSRSHAQAPAREDREKGWGSPSSGPKNEERLVSTMRGSNAGRRWDVMRLGALTGGREGWEIHTPQKMIRVHRVCSRSDWG